MYVNLTDKANPDTQLPVINAFIWLFIFWLLKTQSVH